MKTAFITGITGQDGSYLAELLLDKGYTVHGLIRRASTFNTHRIDHLYKDPHDEDARLFLHYGDLTDSSRLTTLLEKVAPDEVYHLGAQSHVRVSFDEPDFTGDVTGLGTTRILEAIRATQVPARFYQASSSEMFGSTPPPQSESSPLQPRSPYAAAKVYAYWTARNYREAYGMFAVNGILFNHESPRRGETFVSRKISMAAARIAAGLQDHLYLGNLDARRDWGYAKEYVEAMWLMLQAEKPTTSWWPPGRPTRYGTSWASRLGTWGWIGRSTCASTSATFGRRRWTSSWVMLARCGRSWGGWHARRYRSWRG